MAPASENEFSRRELAVRIADALKAACLFPFAEPLTAGIVRDIRGKGETMILPKPKTDGNMSLEKAVKNRRTVRSFDAAPLKTEQLSQILWAAQGITGDGGEKRAAPSGGALYPMDVYAVVGKNSVENISPGIYRYDPGNHSISRHSEGDLRTEVAAASLMQTWMAKAPVNLVITAEYRRICSKYGDRGIRYAMIEAGHVGQNVFLQAVALGLAAGIVGAFDDSRLIRAMNIPETHEPLLIMPVGVAR